MNNVDLVKDYLRAQNLEQVGRVDEAVALYEEVVAEGFDAVGPYDRLITVYGQRSLHREVIRVVDSALVNVQTYADKKAWYERIRSEAESALQRVPRAAPKNRE